MNVETLIGWTIFYTVMLAVTSWWGVSNLTDHVTTIATLRLTAA